MKKDKCQIINHFLTSIFNGILKIEEKNVESNIYPDLSLRDLHILETVRMLELKHNNSSTRAADCLHITPGTLTSAVNILVRKGYIIRTKDEKDKRIVRICVTQKGQDAQNKHQRFHDEMVQQIINRLSDEELDVFLKSIENLADFFQNGAEKLCSKKQCLNGGKE